MEGKPIVPSGVNTGRGLIKFTYFTAYTCIIFLLKRPFKNGSQKRVHHVKINFLDVNCRIWTLSIAICLDHCHVVALCLLLMINVCPTGPAGKVLNLGQSLKLGHLT